MRVSELGEVALIDHLARTLGRAAWGGTRGVIRGIGDDAAVIQVTPGHRLLATCDLLIEGRHFDLKFISAYQLGWKALAVNLSDIAAMGGQPRWALLSLGLPPDLDLSFLEDIYRGVAAMAVKEGVTIVGGDTSGSPGPLVIDITVLGEAPRESVTFRSGCQAGDFILVTGAPGSSAAGLSWLKDASVQQLMPRVEAEPLLKTHLEPQPRCKEAAFLAGFQGVTAMIDLSDGLAAGLLELAAASEKGMLVYADRLPVHPAAVRQASLTQKDLLSWVLYGGEDYELLLTVGGEPGAGRRSRRLIRQFQGLTGVSLTAIGQVTAAEQGVRVALPDDRFLPLERSACYDHFA